MDAVEAAVRNMEDNSIFNAGHGCALTEENTAELDAFIMDGHNLATGYVQNHTAVDFFPFCLRSMKNKLPRRFKWPWITIRNTGTTGLGLGLCYFNSL